MAATEPCCLPDEAKLLRLWRQRWETDALAAELSRRSSYDCDAPFLSDSSRDDSPVSSSLREGQPYWQWESSRSRGGHSDDESDEEDYQPRLTPARQALAKRSMQPSSPASSSSPPSCWICYEHSDESDLIAPCETCTGSLAHVHRHCIATWVATRQTLDPQHPHQRPHCPNCKTQYRKGALHPQRSPSATSPPVRIPGGALRRSPSAHLVPLTLTTTVTTTTVTSPHGAVSTTRHLALSAAGSSTVTSAPIPRTHRPSPRYPYSQSSSATTSTTTSTTSAALRRSSSSVRITSWQRTTTIPHLDVITVTPKAQGPILSCFA